MHCKSNHGSDDAEEAQDTDGCAATLTFLLLGGGGDCNGDADGDAAATEGADAAGADADAVPSLARSDPPVRVNSIMFVTY
jgi:hypothetical protein